MNCKTVMVNLAIGSINKPRIAVAKQLAERFDARLIGVAASEITPPLYFADGDAGQRMIEASMTAIEVAFSTLEAEFDAEVDSDRSEWRCSRQIPTLYVAQEARAADVIVTGQSQDIMMSNAFASADASDLLMGAGRPLLIVPDSVSWIDFRHCVVAWKEAVESRRAIADAIPLLRLVNDVSVVEIIEGGVSSRAAQRHVEDVVAWLECHGVSAAPLVVEKKGDVGEQLERIAADAGAGLVVAGAYGNSRLRQWVFGGVTRHFLQNRNGVRCSQDSRPLLISIKLAAQIGPNLTQGAGKLLQEGLLLRFLEETVADHMTTSVKTVTRKVSMEQLKKRFDADDFNAYAVVEHGHMLGLMTKFDFLKVFALEPSHLVPHYNELMKRTVGDAMTKDFISVSPAAKLSHVLQLMVSHRVRSVPVIRGRGSSSESYRGRTLSRLFGCARTRRVNVAIGDRDA